MGTPGRSRLKTVLWGLLLSQLCLLGLAQAPTTSASLDCGCENTSSNANILDDGNSSVCPPCACFKTTRIPVVFTTVFTVYDSTTSTALVSTSGPVSSSGTFPSGSSSSDILVPGSSSSGNLLPGSSSSSKSTSGILAPPQQTSSKLSVTLSPGSSSQWTTTSKFGETSFSTEGSTLATLSSLSSPESSQAVPSLSFSDSSIALPSFSSSTDSSQFVPSISSQESSRVVPSLGLPESSQSAPSSSPEDSSRFVPSLSSREWSWSVPSLDFPESSETRSIITLPPIPSFTSFSFTQPPLPPTSIGFQLPSPIPVASNTFPTKTSTRVSITPPPAGILPSPPHVGVSISSSSSTTAVFVPPGGTITVEPLTATTPEPDGSYKTTSVTWLSIDVPSLTTVGIEVQPNIFPAWRCISLEICNNLCLVPFERCLPSPPNPLGFPWPEQPAFPPSSEHGSLFNPSVTPTSNFFSMHTPPDRLTFRTTTSTSGGGSGGGGDDGGDDNDDDGDDEGGDDDDDDGGDDEGGDDDDDDGGDDEGEDDDDDDGGDNDDDDDGNDDDQDDDNQDDDHHDDHNRDDDTEEEKKAKKELNKMRVDIDLNDDWLLFFFGLFKVSVRSRLRLILNLKVPWKIDGGSGGGGGGGGGEPDPDDPEPSLSTSTRSTSSSTSSCTFTYTLAPHCTQPCVVSHISNIATNSLTTSCTTVRCETTELCTSIQTTTTTTYTTKRPGPTAGCAPKSCPACKDSKAKNIEGVTKRNRPEDAILQNIMTSPDTWEYGPEDWWEKMRLVAKSYGPGYHGTSAVHMDSTSAYDQWRNFPMGGGAGPVWGCAMVVAFSDKGIWTSHLWEVPNFSIPNNEEFEYFYENGKNRQHYFQQNVDYFLQHGSSAQPWQDEYPGLGEYVGDGQTLSPKNAKFYKVFVFVPTHDDGDFTYPLENQRMVNVLVDKLGIDKEYISLYGYVRRVELQEDYNFDGGNTPPPEYRQAPAFAGLFSWLYTPKGASGKKELVVRYEQDVIWRLAWCDGDSLVDDLEGLTLGPIKREQQTCPKTTYCTNVCAGDNFCNVGGGTKSLRKALPDVIPTYDEIYLTNNFYDPEPSPQEDITYWRSVRMVIEDYGAQYGSNSKLGLPFGGSWSTSEITVFDREKGTGALVDRPRFGGSGPVWGCTMVVVASPAGVYTSHMWEVPGFSRAERTDKHEAYKKIFPGNLKDYTRNHVFKFLAHGNDLGDQDDFERKKPRSKNPGLDEHFAPGGMFNVEESEWIWVGIFTPTEGGMERGGPEYTWAVAGIIQLFAGRWGVPVPSINLHTYVKKDGYEIIDTIEDHPHWGTASWRYHPRFNNGNREVKLLVIRHEDKIIERKVWCGSGRVAPLNPHQPLEDGHDSSDPRSAPEHKRRDDDGAVCTLAADRFSAPTSSFARSSPPVPRPTQICAADLECASLGCPGKRVARCHHERCRCVFEVHHDNSTTTATISTVESRPWSTISANLTTATSTSWSITTSNLTSITSQSSPTITSNSTSSSSSISTWTGRKPFTTITVTRLPPRPSVWPTKTIATAVQPTGVGAACEWNTDCANLVCLTDQYPKCVIPSGKQISGCYCVDRPHQGDVCALATDCNEMYCEKNHYPRCDVSDTYSTCICQPRPVTLGSACDYDTQCTDVHCVPEYVQSGICDNGSCGCALRINLGSPCTSHDGCNLTRSNATHPYKTCNKENWCELTAHKPAARPEEPGDFCMADKQCVGIRCQTGVLTVSCENNKCKCGPVW